MARHKNSKNHAQHRESHRQTKHHNGAAEERFIDETDSAIRGLEAVQQEATEFMNRRVGQAIDTLERYQECRNIGEMFAVQQDWLRTAAQDYIQIGFRLAQAVAGAASENAARMERLVEAEAIDITARTQGTA